MINSSGRPITFDTVRAQLSEFVTHVGDYPPSAYLLDDAAKNYVREHGLVPVNSVPLGDVLRLLTFWRAQGYTENPCPPWCELEPGHDWDTDSATGRQLRTHGRDLACHTSLSLTEYADEPGLRRPAVLGVFVDEVRDWTAAAARVLAAELLNAADELDRVTGRSQWTEDRL